MIIIKVNKRRLLLAEGCRAGQVGVMLRIPFLSGL